MSFMTCIFSCSDDALIETPDNDIADTYVGKNYDSVIYYASRSLKMNLGNVADYYSHYLLGFSYQKKGQYQKAFDHYLKARDMTPKDKKYDFYISYSTLNI